MSLRMRHGFQLYDTIPSWVTEKKATGLFRLLKTFHSRGFVSSTTIHVVVPLEVVLRAVDPLVLGISTAPQETFSSMMVGWDRVLQRFHTLALLCILAPGTSHMINRAGFQLQTSYVHKKRGWISFPLYKIMDSCSGQMLCNSVRCLHHKMLNRQLL